MRSSRSPITKKLIISLFGLNMFIMFIFFFYQMSLHEGFTSRNLTVQEDDLTPIQQLTKAATSSKLRFDNPAAAYELLTQLDVFSVVEGSYSGKKGDFDYCNEHRLYFVSNPEMVFRDKYHYVATFVPVHQLRRTAIKAIGVDMSSRRDRTGKSINGQAVDTNIFAYFALNFKTRQIGKQFSCLTQSSNHIPGHERLYRKDILSAAVVNYASGYKTRPQCFSYDKYFPKTFILKDQKQCEEFFQEFNSDLYKKMKKERNIVYFRKIGAGVHEGKGVFPVDTSEEKVINKLYDYGKKCGKVTDNNLIQYNVHNLLLVMNRKFGFRSFLFVASNNPLIAYYHDGYARLSLNEYDSKSKEKSTFVTNIGVNVQNPAFAGWSKRQIDEYTCWSMAQFTEHLYKTGVVSDPDWLNNHLRKEFMKVKIHLLRMAQGGYKNVSSVFEIYGLDYVMDENLNLWFIEANTMPLMDGFTAHTKDLFHNLFVDAYDIISGLMKSRAKRIINYINMLNKEEGTDLVDLQARREEFRKLSMNKFEPEFQPRANSTFYKIIDENLQGTARYSGLLAEECLPRNVTSFRGV